MPAVQKQMNYRTNTKNGDALSVLGFGCMRFPMKGNSVDIERTEAMLKRAMDAGVNYFDTAYIYHRGKSEAILGDFLSKGYRSQVKIATKLPHYLVGKPEDIEKIFRKQLDRLKTDYIDYYLIHMLPDIGSWNRLKQMGIEEWIDQKKQNGQIRNIGFSFHGVKEQFLKLVDCYDWEFCQIQYNYLDENNQAGTEGLRYAASKGLPVIVMEPLRGGKIVNALPKELSAMWAGAQPKRSVAEWGLRWVWNHPEVNVVLSGMSTEEQLEENLRIASDVLPNAMSREELDYFEQANKILSEKMKVGCTACGYCMPCPAGVDIPGCFSIYNEKYMLGTKHIKMQYMRNTGAYTAHPAYASLCIKCGKCETHCPQQIPIREKLKDVVSEMEGPLFRPIAAVGKRIMGSKK